MESTYNWCWLVDGLMAAGYQVHLANFSGLYDPSFAFIETARSWGILNMRGDVMACRACALRSTLR